MRQALNSLDLFGPKFTFNAEKGSQKYKTPFGGLLSLIAIFLFSMLSVSVMLKCKDTTKPIISVNTIKLKKAPHINLNEHQIGMMLMISLGTRLMKAEEISRFFTIKAEIKQTLPMDKTRMIKSSGVRLPVGSCAAYHSDVKKNLEEYAMKHPDTFLKDSLERAFKNAVYPDLRSPSAYLEGGKGSMASTRLEVKFYPCSLPHPKKCASHKELMRVLVFSFPLIKIANLSKKANPLSNFLDFHTRGLPISSRTKIRMIQYMKKNEIYDNDKIFRRQKLSQKFVDVGKVWLTTGSRLSASKYCSREEMASGDCEPYFEFFVESCDQKTVIRRFYRKFFGSVSEIGGYTDIILYVFSVLYFFSNRNRHQGWIRGQLVDQFLELEQQRGHLRRKRSPSEVALLKNAVLAKSTQFDSDVTFRGIFCCDVCFHNLMELNFKSKVILFVLKNKQLDFLYREVILAQKGFTGLVKPDSHNISRRAQYYQNLAKDKIEKRGENQK